MQRRWPLSSWCSGVPEEGFTKERAVRNPHLPVIRSDEGVHQSEGIRRLALLLEYDGTKFKGFQWQANSPSIQQEVEDAIKSFSGENTRIRGASRTDSGVHARGQVVDFLSWSSHPPVTFVKALNWYLPRDIRVRGAWDISLDFHSRKDATSRIYRYTVLNSRWPSALMRDFSFWLASPLDVAKMATAAACLVGSHDFSRLTGSLPLERSPVRRVDRWDVWREGATVFMEAEANGFLPHQIRRTGGLLVEIGTGSAPVGMMKEMIHGKLNGPKAIHSLPAKGLCLMKVKYSNTVPGIEISNET